MRPQTEEQVPTDEALRLWFFESLDRIHRAMRRRPDLEDALRDAFDEVMDVLACDRVWLASPCAVDSPTFQIVIERTRPTWPGALVAGLEIPTSSELVAANRLLLEREAPVCFGLGGELPLPGPAAASGAKSAIMMAVDPRVDRPYVFGMHRCEVARPSSEHEVRLFQEIGRRVGDALAAALVVRDLRERERQLERAGRVAKVGHWERDLKQGTVTLSPEACRILGVPTSEGVQPFAEWSRWLASRVHPEDRERLRAAVNAASAGSSSYELEYRLVDPDSKVRVVHSRAERVVDADGRTTRLFGTIQDITSRRHLEERIVASEALYRGVVDQASDALFVHDQDGRLVDVNRQACESLGYGRDEMIGMTPADFDPGVTPEFLGWMLPKLRRGETVSFEAKHRRRDGSEFPVEVRMRMFNVGDRQLSVALARDISERVLAEKALRTSEERFRELAETIAEVFWVTNADKTAMLYVSPGYERIWGRLRKELYESPRSWLESIHEDDRERVLAAALTKQAEGTYDEEYRIVRPDGEVRWIRDAAFPVRDDQGNVIRIVGLARDTTERRGLQEQLLHAQKMEALGRLAGGIAHDFNNLLGAILMLADEPDESAGVSEEVRATFGEIATTAKRAAALTRKLLLFGRRQSLRMRPLEVNEVVSELAKMLRRVIGEGIELVLAFDSSPLVVLGDASMLEQVLVNLTVNARDAMPAGGVLTIETTAVELDTASAARIAGGRSGRYARLTVTDTGTGIPPDIMPRIFDPFFTTKGPDRGTGLGLATVFGIVKEHGGWCSVSSELGRGSRFEVLIPLHDSDAATRKPPEVQSRGGCETILLVEDEPQLRDGTKRMLERYGYRVFEADSGDAALQLWPNIRGQVTLLLTDVVMAGSLNGDELATRLRGDQPNLRVVLMSGYSAEDISSGTRARGDTFLEKPVARDELLGALRSALDGGQYR